MILHYLFYISFSILIFQPLPSKKAADRQTDSLKTVCTLAFQSFVNVLILHFASLLDVLSSQCGLQKYTFEVLVLEFNIQ